VSFRRIASVCVTESDAARSTGAVIAHHLLVDILGFDAAVDY
jgi:hypothetical protein